VERNKEHASISCGDVHIPADISKDELERRIAVFGAGHYGLSLTVTLHGREFRYTAPEVEHKVDAPSIVPAEQAVEPA